MIINYLSHNIIDLPTVDSTNDYCKKNIDALDNFDIVYSLCQTSGKGTGRKKWHSKPGECLAFSMVLKQTRLEDLTILPLLWGLVISSALKEVTNLAVGIKWPNDVLIGKRKICGILCESSISGNRIDAVCGLGININQSKERFEEQNLLNATSLFAETGNSFQVSEIIRTIINHWDNRYHEFLKAGLDSFKNEYLQNCITIGKQVRVIQDSKEMFGIALGISDNGSLICEIDGEPVQIHHGEASIRGLWDYA